MIPASTSSHLRLGEGAEFDAIRSMLGEWGSRAAGIGDDGALLDVPAGERLVVSTDASIENVHFRREWLSAQQIGARAAAAALSDLAAMAAMPLGLLLALGVPPDWEAELTELARGVGVAAERAGCAIVGGNIARSSALSLTFTVLGSTSRALHRAGAKAGDIVYVTGRLGGAGAALASLLAGRVPRAADMKRFAAPTPRLAEARWLVEHGVHAGIDLSDGLLADVGHLARASGVSVEIDLGRLPLVDDVDAAAAAVSGEEYELVVVAPCAAPLRREEFAARFDLSLTEIGVVRDALDPPVIVIGSRVDPARGHDHFS